MDLRVNQIPVPGSPFICKVCYFILKVYLLIIVVYSKLQTIVVSFAHI